MLHRLWTFFHVVQRKRAGCQLQAASWVSNRSAEALLATLDNHSSALGALYDMVHDTDADQAHWTNQALAVYRDALAAGCRPRLHVLERVLACLRLPVSAAPPAGQPAAALARPVLPAVKVCVTPCLVHGWAQVQHSGVHTRGILLKLGIIIGINQSGAQGSGPCS